jgi:RNA polymerase sigma-70 factor (ECF subfamily)
METMTGTADHDMVQTVTSAAAGDELAFARIVSAHHSEMYRICVFVCRDATIAEEAVQAAWLVAWRKLGSVRDPEHLRPWLVAISVNQAKDLLRKRRRRAQIEVIADPSGEPGGRDPATGVDSMDLEAALERLAPDERALLAMRYVAGFNATELSEALGISPSGTRSRLEKLVTGLRQELT